MWNNWVGRRIRGGGRAMVLWGLVLCAAAAGVARLYPGALPLVLAGPVPVGGDELAKGTGRLSRGPVAFSPTEAAVPVATLSKPNQPDTVFARYLAAPAGDRWLLVKVPGRHEGDSFTGVFAALSGEERDRVVAAFARANGVNAERFLPFRLDCTEDGRRPLVAGLFFLTVLFVPGLVLTALGLRRLFRPETHPLARALARFGPPAEVADALGAGRPLRLGPVEFSGDWLVCRSPRAGYAVFRVADLVWVHKLLETVNRTPLHRIKLYDRHGVLFTGRGRADVVEAAYAAVRERVPWVLAGWDERIARQWQDDPASLVPRVEERRQEMQANHEGRPEP